MPADLAQAQAEIARMREHFATIRDRLSMLDIKSPFAPDVIHAMHGLAAEQAIPNNGYPTPAGTRLRDQLAGSSHWWTCSEHQEKSERLPWADAEAGLSRHLAEHHHGLSAHVTTETGGAVRDVR
jgi:hypothetical protein